jgi:hypothetical protein
MTYFGIYRPPVPLSGDRRLLPAPERSIESDLTSRQAPQRVLRQVVDKRAAEVLARAIGINEAADVPLTRLLTKAIGIEHPSDEALSTLLADAKRESSSGYFLYNPTYAGKEVT